MRAYGLVLLAIFAGLAVAAQFNNALFYTWILAWWWTLVGLVLGLESVLPKKNCNLPKL